MCKSDTHAGTRKAALAEMYIWAEQARSGECQVCQPVGLMRNLRFENKNLLAGQPSDGRAERARPIAGNLWPFEPCGHVLRETKTKTQNKSTGLSKRTSTSATGTRARVARVRAEYPSQLDYSGICVSEKKRHARQSIDRRAERARSVA